MSKTDLTAERLRELLHYDAETGVFRWRVDRSIKTKAGAVAGNPQRSGHLRIGIDRREHQAHRLAWLYVTGKHPDHQIDHINGDPRDNRFANLRDVPVAVNIQNQRKPRRDNASGFLGVSPWKNRWQAHICVFGKRQYLGQFETPEAAHSAYLVAKREMHAGCTI